MSSLSYFTGSAMILTKDGYKEIKNILDNDLVLTHLANWKQVISKQSHMFKGSIYYISHAANSSPIMVPNDHLFLVKTIYMTRIEPLSYELSKETSLVLAQDLERHKHVLCVPIIQEKVPTNITITINNEFKRSNKIDYFMVGYYVGNQGNFINIEFIPPGWSILQEFTKHENPDYPTLCNTIPEWMQSLPIRDLKDFINGFEHSSKANDNEYNAINELVALSLQRIYAKINILTKIILSGSHALISRVDNNLQGRFTIDDKYMYIPIENINSLSSEQTVYNIEVADDNSYMIENITICNSN